MVQERIQTDNGTTKPDTFFRTYVYDPRSFAPLAMIISEPDQSSEPNLNDQLPREIFGEALDNVVAIMGDQFPKEWLRLKNPIKEILFFENDHLGTPQRLIDKTGKVRWQANMDAWGKQRSDTNGNYPPIASEDYIEQPLRFQGQQFDVETGFHYNRHRYYDPHSGRYLSHDPIGARGGANIYAYVKNPTRGVDPLGLLPLHNDAYCDAVGGLAQDLAPDQSGNVADVAINAGDVATRGGAAGAANTGVSVVTTGSTAISNTICAVNKPARYEANLEKGAAQNDDGTTRRTGSDASQISPEQRVWQGCVGNQMKRDREMSQEQAEKNCGPRPEHPKVTEARETIKRNKDFLENLEQSKGK